MVQMAPGPEQNPGDRWRSYCDRVFVDLRAYLIGNGQGVHAS